MHNKLNIDPYTSPKVFNHRISGNRPKKLKLSILLILISYVFHLLELSIYYATVEGLSMGILDISSLVSWTVLTMWIISDIHSGYRNPRWVLFSLSLFVSIFSLHNYITIFLLSLTFGQALCLFTCFFILSPNKVDKWFI